MRRIKIFQMEKKFLKRLKILHKIIMQYLKNSNFFPSL